jgi:hypothetical protein
MVELVGIVCFVQVGSQVGRYRSADRGRDAGLEKDMSRGENAGRAMVGVGGADADF